MTQFESNCKTIWKWGAFHLILILYFQSGTAKTFILVPLLILITIQKIRFLSQVAVLFPWPINILSPRDVRRFKDVRKEFERSSECLEGAQSRNAQAPRGKQHEVEEASNNLLNARRAFRSEALDYVLQVRHISSATLRFFSFRSSFPLDFVLVLRLVLVSRRLYGLGLILNCNAFLIVSVLLVCTGRTGRFWSVDTQSITL